MSAHMRLCFIIASLAIGATANVQSEAADVSGPLRNDTRTLMLGESSPDPRVTNWPGKRRFARLPPVSDARQQETASEVGRAVPVDGTFRNEGQTLVVNINGQDYHLERSDLPPVSSEAQEAARSQGSVHGRLSHGGRPLADCEVALVRLNKNWAGYRMIPADKPITTTTDSSGVYHFTAVEPGSYKLKWRPAGESEWIRRAELRPDVHVRDNESSEVKEVRVALRTIN